MIVDREVHRAHWGYGVEERVFVFVQWLGWVGPVNERGVVCCVDASVVNAGNEG